MRKLASTGVTSNSVEQCEIEVCFLPIQLMGNNVGLSKIHRSPSSLEVDFES